METEIIEDYKLINEIIIIEKNFLECVLKIEEYYKDYKSKFEQDFSNKSKKLIDILKDISYNEKTNKYKNKYIETYKELQKYRKNMEILVKMSKPIISESYMRKLLKEQKVIQDTISKVNKSFNFNT